MEPRIQYAKTSDGVSIAYWAIGDGPLLIDLGTPPASHVLMEWQFPEMRRWYERFAQHHRLVRFDGRGTGLSDREVEDYSLLGLVADLEAVIQRVGISPVILLGAINSSPVAIAYASKHPDQVSSLVLWCPYACGAEFFDDTATQALRIILEKDWSMFTETASHSRFSWAGGDFPRASQNCGDVP